MDGTSTGKWLRNVSSYSVDNFEPFNNALQDGRVIRIPAFMGVCRTSLCYPSQADLFNDQDSWLYVFDPKALHHIIVKVWILALGSAFRRRFIWLYPGTTYFWRNISLYRVHISHHHREIHAHYYAYVQPGEINLRSALAYSQHWVCWFAGYIILCTDQLHRRAAP